MRTARPQRPRSAAAISSCPSGDGAQWISPDRYRAATDTRRGFSRMGTQAHRVAARRQSPTTGRLRRPRGTSSSWYKDAIIYELHVRVHPEHVDRAPGLPDRSQKAMRFIVLDDVEDAGQEHQQLASLADTRVLAHGERLGPRQPGGHSRKAPRHSACDASPQAFGVTPAHGRLRLSRAIGPGTGPVSRPGSSRARRTSAAAASDGAPECDAESRSGTGRRRRSPGGTPSDRRR
jgi:hypothetical protein